MIAVLLGPPGVGKGTQATRLTDAHGWRHISSGDVLRREAEQDTPRGRALKEILATGRLVPDDTTLQIVLDHILKAAFERGVLLDGFPRTVVQARALDAALSEHGRKLDLALLLDADVDEVARRISGRLTCRRCGAVYHTTYNPPKVPGVCDRCGGELYHRSDDDEATVRHRMAVYVRDTAPLIDYYESQGKLERVDGGRPIDEVYASLDGIIRGAKV